MPDDHTPAPGGPPPAGAFEDWQRRYQQRQQDVVTAAVAWHTVHQLQLLPDASSGEDGLRKQLCADADRLLDAAVIGLLATGRTAPSGDR